MSLITQITKFVQGAWHILAKSHDIKLVDDFKGLQKGINFVGMLILGDYLTPNGNK